MMREPYPGEMDRPRPVARYACIGFGCEAAEYHGHCRACPLYDASDDGAVLESHEALARIQDWDEAPPTGP